MKYTLFTKHEIKMAGYWPSPVFAFLCTRIKSRSKRTKKTKKKEWGSTLIRIKNDLLIFILFFSFIFFGFRSIITSWQSFTFSLFWLFAAPLLKLTKNYKLLVWKSAPRNFFSSTGTKQAIPRGQDRPILPTQVANQKAGFASYLTQALPAK